MVSLTLTACAVLGLAWPLLAMAAKEYTPAQLRQMVNSGNYPKQGQVKTQAKAMNFDECVASMSSMAQASRPNYPTVQIVDTSVLWVHKVWVNDAAMTLSCSKPDKKGLITSSPYR